MHIDIHSSQGDKDAKILAVTKSERGGENFPSEKWIITK